MRPFLLLLCLTLCLLPAPAAAEGLELRFGLDYLTRKQSDITGLHQLSLTYRYANGFYLGESLYSSALGTGGGFFAGGLEFGGAGKLGSTVGWEVGQFVGGGGGASQVTGNGLMLRTHAALDLPIADFRLGLGAAWLTVSGSDINTPSVTLTLVRPIDLRLSAGRPGTARPETTGTVLKAFRPLYSLYLPLHSQKRDGANLERMHLVGAEISFDTAALTETFIQASGVAGGDAEGYADWLLGQRYLFSQDTLQPFVELGVGTAGGGGVDTDGGLIVMAGIGGRYVFSNAAAIEAGCGLRSSIDGGFLALTPALRVSVPFAPAVGTANDPRGVNWQLRSGLTLQRPNTGFRKDRPDAGPAPLLYETGLNFFFHNHLYLTGLAATAIEGDAGGYQLGLLGIGYQQTISDKLSFAFEPMIGAGGGGGVDTRGGLLLGYRLNADFWLTDSVALSAGVGQMTTFKGGGMQPETFHLGLKIPFTSWH